jgi:hypothetical protein
MNDLATYDAATTPTVSFERDLEHPIDAVWRAISDFEEMAHWFPCLVSGEMRVRGPLTFDFVTRDGAGWTVCLERLARQLAAGGGVAPGSARTDEWQVYYEEYERRGFPADARIPE